MRDVVVIGASAGGVEALRDLVRELPPDLPAAVLVVLHLPADARSALPGILARTGKLPTSTAESGMRLDTGKIYVAPPNRHLVLEDGSMQLVGGPRENGVRPAIDPLFRSAAKLHGRRTIGIVLSGTLDDGSSGLLAVKAAGGMTMVQSPQDAHFPGMPEWAILTASPEHVLTAAEIGRKLPELVREEGESAAASVSGELRRELEIGAPPTDTDAGAERAGSPSTFSCPECHGTLWEVEEGELAHFRCRVGHAFSLDSLSAAQSADVERALWTALRSLQERRGLMQQMSRRWRLQGREAAAARYDERAQELDRQVNVLDKLVSSRVEQEESSA